jgi:predicted glycosyltransferase
MKRPIGYYVHHHGDGHRQRALAIAQAAPGGFTLLGTGLAGRTAAIPCLDLPADHPVCCAGSGIGDSLHYAPYDHSGIRQRIAIISDWIVRAKPALLVADVSVEVAMLARLTSTPLVYVRLSGTRHDQPHLDAFRAALAVMSPFHAELDDPETAPWIREKTAYLPGLSGSRFRTLEPGGTILVIGGKGGAALDGAALAAAAAATPERNWRVIGRVTPADQVPPNLVIMGWVDTADAEIVAAGIVIGHAGDGVVNAVIAAGRPFICLPQPRPFDEQIAKAARLHALKAAIVVDTWPDATAWPALLRRAESLDPGAIRRLHDPDGAVKAAAFLQDLAD